MVMADEAWTGRWGGYARPQRQRAGRVRPAGGAQAHPVRPARVHAAAQAHPVRPARAHAAAGARAGGAARARQAWAVRLRTLARPLGSVWVMGPALVGMAVLVALALVYLHVACLDTGHRILALEKELRALQADNERLQLAVLRLDSPARVEQVARDKLGMVPVREARVVTAAPDQVREVQPPVTVSWLERVALYLAGLLEGRGVLAGPAR